MPTWTFRTYVDPNGAEAVAEWYEAQSPKVQAAFDRRLAFLQQRRPDEWRDPLSKQLHGACDGLVEIRFKAERVQHRPLGFFGPGRWEFTVLFFATEKGGRFDPRDACEIALRRRDAVVSDPNASVVFDVA